MSTSYSKIKESLINNVILVIFIFIINKVWFNNIWTELTTFTMPLKSLGHLKLKLF